MSPHTPQHPQGPERPEDVEAQVHQLLVRAAAPASDEAATSAAVLARAHRRGRVRLRRRRSAWAVAGAAAAVLAVAAVINPPALGGGQEGTRRLVPAGPSPVSSPTSSPWTSTPQTSGLDIPLPERGDDHLADLPGDPSFDWRGQVTEAMRRYPGTFVLPEQLPPGVLSVRANSINGYAVTDVSEEGPFVIVCALDEATCRNEVAATWNLVRTTEVDGRAVYVLSSPPGQLTSEQRRFWETVTLTTEAPDWLSTDS